jgi:soluble lytic murein transglycosylase-like protein
MVSFMRLETTAPKKSAHDVKETLFNYSIKYKYITTNTANRYVDVILQESTRYNLDPLLVAKMIKVESHFKWWAKSEVGALGPMQVMPIHWGHLLYSIDDKSLQKKLKKKYDTKYFQRIGYGVHSGCRILRHYLDKNDNDLILSLIDYGYGPGTKTKRISRTNFKYAKSRQYIQKVVYRQ